MAQLASVWSEASQPIKNSERRFYRPELDGLRFYAFLGVFMYHTLPSQVEFYSRMHLPLPGLWAAVAKSGAAGVDLFFALSAFLITSLLLRERQKTGGIALGLFYIRRVLRIWPLYFAVLLLGVVLAHTMKDQAFPWYYIAGLAFFVGNWVSASAGHLHSICSPLWTVSIEEQFYLLWPPLMKTLKPRTMIIAASLTFLLATLSQVGVVLAGWSGGYIYYGSLSRSNSLVLGILLALLVDRLPSPAAGTRSLLVGGGLAGWIAAAAWLVDQPGLPNTPLDMRVVWGRLLISLASGAILYGCLASRNLLLRGRWVTELGKRSYGLYMLHATAILIVLSLLHPFWGWQLLACKGLALMITVLLAFASYRFIESPFLRLKERFTTVLSRSV